MCGIGNRLRNLVQVSGTAGGLEVPGGLEAIDQQHHVDFAALVVHFLHLLEQPTVCIFEEVVGAKQQCHLVDHFGHQQDAAQNALLGGGRYDHLVKQLGGPDRAGIGFAAGLERLVLAMPEAATATTTLDAFIVAIGEDARSPAHVLARDLRHAGLSVLIDHGARSAKAQMKKADRADASYVLLLGEDEIARDEVTVKHMATGEQRAVARTAVAEQLGAGL